MRDEGAALRERPSSLIFHPTSFLTRYGPVLVWLAVIFFASTGSLSASNTSRIIRPLVLWAYPDISEAALLQIHIFVRKAAHFTEYAVLALLAARAFLTSEGSWLRRNWHLCAFALVAVCALLDEFHQSFEATRTGTIYDSLLDMSGGAAALALLALFRRLRNSPRRRGERRGGAEG
jgi:VanZ family protein